MRTSIRTFLTGVLLSLISIAAIQAQNPSGIHIEGGARRIVVFLDGAQMSIPSNSCFIANLDDGLYLLQVYDASGMSAEGRCTPAKLLYREMIDYRKGLVVEVNVGNTILPDDGYGEGMESYPFSDLRGVMAPRMFDEFLAALKNARWDSERDDILETAVLTSRFTCRQCLSMMDLYRFDSDKLEFIEEIFPAVADKENIFLLYKGFQYDSSRDRFRDFLREQHGSQKELFR